MMIQLSLFFSQALPMQLTKERQHSAFCLFSNFGATPTKKTNASRERDRGPQQTNKRYTSSDFGRRRKGKMMMSNSGSNNTSCFQNLSRQQSTPQMYVDHLADDVLSSSIETNTTTSTTPPELVVTHSLLYNLSVLKEKVHQAQSLAIIAVTTPHQNQLQQSLETNSIAIAGITNLIQEILVTASSMMLTCQQLSQLGGVPLPPVHVARENEHGSFFPNESSLDWYGDNYNNNTNNCSITTLNHSNNNNNNKINNKKVVVMEEMGSNGITPLSYHIVELAAADLLAKYTHYCEVCGKGFKRDANLRMHMRAHGDEFKTSAALSNPMKNNSTSTNSPMGSNDIHYSKLPSKYSCPHEGCRWNRRHPKFQPLKSMICVKNHYRRSHCPKMYVCNRCTQKQFSVLSDLRTHEKHCGDLKWQCSCGTTFSRKDKLMGHVSLFFGHTPAGNTFMKQEKFDFDTNGNTTTLRW